MIRFISLFSGIGGIDLGLERAGMKCVGQVERDPFCRLILEKHWPGLPKWNDIRNFRKALWENYCRVNNLDPHVDLVCGGFPCQDISSAGKGVGITGKRSGLWKQMFRIVREFRPRWVLVENVPVLRTRGADTVLSDLESLGYVCWPVVVGAWAAGSPQERNRAWIIAELADTGSSSQRGNTKSISSGKSKSGGTGVADTHSGRSGKDQLPSQLRTIGAVQSPGNSRVQCSATQAEQVAQWPTGPGEPQRSEEPRRLLIKQLVGGDFDGIPERLVRLNNGHSLKAYGNAVVPDVVLAIGKAIAARHVGAI